jgi:pentatricopeptide repeat protein
LSQNPEEGLKDLQQLLSLERIDSAVRIGDIYSILIEYHANRQRWKQAFTILSEMREIMPESSIRYYINPKLIMTIHGELGIEYKMPSQQRQQEENTFKSNNQPKADNSDDEIRDTIGYGTYED